MLKDCNEKLVYENSKSCCILVQQLFELWLLTAAQMLVYNYY